MNKVGTVGTKEVLNLFPTTTDDWPPLESKSSDLESYRKNESIY